eukprot:6447368-Amphidinium_carterae.1
MDKHTLIEDYEIICPDALLSTALCRSKCGRNAFHVSRSLHLQEYNRTDDTSKEQLTKISRNLSPPRVTQQRVQAFGGNLLVTGTGVKCAKYITLERRETYGLLLKLSHLLENWSWDSSVNFRPQHVHLKKRGTYMKAYIALASKAT